jgi:uncharacterized protein (DUF1684 family)
MIRGPRRLLSAAAIALPFAVALAAQAGNPPPEKLSYAEWRSWRLQRLTSETGWVTLIGLHWLEPGDNALGSAPGSKLPLPADKAPAKVAVLKLENGKVTLIPEPASGLTIAGQPVTAPWPLASDADPEPTEVELGSINFHLVARGDRIGLRVRDREAKLRREFPGLDYFAPDPAARVEARFEPHPPGTTVPIANVLGMTDAMNAPGKVSFTLQGQEFTVTALDDTGDGRLFLIVADKTNGYETYGGGRYLYTDPPKDGKVIVDFNRAYNPPCAFTPWSTCPLPPKENKLPIRIEAGEKKFAGAHS